MSAYTASLRRALEALGHPAVDPRHVEAHLRVEHGSLDALSGAALQDEVAVCVRCIREGGTAEAEQLAQSYGL